MRNLIIVAAGLLIAACATEVPVAERPQVEATEAYVAANAAICRDAGGDYIRDGMRGWYQCVYPYPDAGEPCFDSSECEGQCRADVAGSHMLPEGSMTGTCQMTTSPFGCYATVENGQVGATLCVD